MDESRRERTLQCSIGNELKIRREFLVDPRRISLRRTFDQLRGALSRACLHYFLSLRGHGATKDSSVSISDGGRRALLVLSAASVDFGICWIRLGIFDRHSRIDNVDHVVLPLFPRQRRAHIDDRRRTGGRLHISLYHFAAAGLRAAHGRNRALYRVGNRDVRDPQSGLVRARRGIDADRSRTSQRRRSIAPRVKRVATRTRQTVASFANGETL